MIHKKQIIEMSRKILRRQAGLHDYQIMHPTRDWLIGLLIAVSIFLVGAATSAQLYFTNKNASLETDTQTEEVVVYRDSLVGAALLRLSEREAVFNGLQNSSARPVPTATSPLLELASSTPVQPLDVATTTSPAVAPPVEAVTDGVVVPSPL